jgi:xanthine/CO dehydrogenase XdhC/CoxF family maturation factor
MKHELDRVIETARAIMRGERHGVVVTLLRTSGSTYRRFACGPWMAPSWD